MTPELRLSNARQALLGEVGRPGRLEMNDDVVLFKILTEKRKPEMDALMTALGKYISESTRDEWEAEISRPQNSSRAMARAQAPSARQYPNQDLGAVTARLVRKASTTHFSTQDMADIEGLLNRSSPRAQLIEDILRALGQLGISSSGEPSK